MKTVPKLAAEWTPVEVATKLEDAMTAAVGRKPHARGYMRVPVLGRSVISGANNLNQITGLKKYDTTFEVMRTHSGLTLSVHDFRHPDTGRRELLGLVRVEAVNEDGSVEAQPVSVACFSGYLLIANANASELFGMHGSDQFPLEPEAAANHGNGFAIGCLNALQKLTQNG